MLLQKKDIYSTCSLVLILLFSATRSKAQGFSAIETKLAALANTMVKDTFVENRLIAVDSFNQLFIKTLQQKDAFKYSFSQIEAISVKAPIDSAFRIFTWQIVGKEAKSTYYGVIQTKGKKPKVFVLNDKTSEIENPDFDICTPEQWYGGVYYNFKEFRGKNGKQYLLFGYNQSPIYERIKFVDILTYRNGKFTFGSPMFTQKGKENRARLLMVYGAEAKARMNFDEATQQIIFDHLVSVKHELLGMTLIPDGDFEGYKLEKGLWTYVNDAVKTTVLEDGQAERPFPILDKRKNRNLFGKKSK
jgi:hypothetical protein